MANPIVVDQEYDLNADEILSGDLSVGATYGTNPVFSNTTTPNNGVLDLNTNGTFTLTPAEDNICSVVCFNYKVTDDAGTSNISSANTIFEEVSEPDPIPDADSYYVSNTGLDTNDGLSAATPWQTWQKVYDKIEDATITASSSIKLKCGDIFITDNTNNTIAVSFGANTPLVIEPYGIGTRPILRTDTVTSTIVLSGGIGTNEGVTFKNIHFDKPTADYTHITVYRGYGSVIISRCLFTGKGAAIVHSYGTSGTDVAYTGHLYINNIFQQERNGIAGSSNNMLIADNLFDGCVTLIDNSSSRHCIELTSGSSSGITHSDIVVENNVFDDTCKNDLTVMGDTRYNSSIMTNKGNLDNVTYRKNIGYNYPDLSNANNHGIRFNAASTTNVTIEDNLLLNIGEAGISMNSTSGAVIQRNTIVQTGEIEAWLIKLDSGDSINDNILIENNDLYIEEDVSATPVDQVFIDDSVGTNVTVQNNSETFFIGNDSNFLPVVFDYAYSIAATTKLFGNLSQFAIVNQTGVVYVATTLPTKGILLLNDNGSFSYDPTNKTQIDTDSFTYSVNDNGIVSNIKNVTVAITAPEMVSTTSIIEDDNMKLISLSQEGVPKVERKNTEYIGPWTFEYRYTDVAGSDTATVTVNITE